MNLHLLHHLTLLSSAFKRASLLGQTETGLAPRIFFLLPRLADSDDVQIAISFVIRNRQIWCSIWSQCMGHIVKMDSSVSLGAPHTQFGEGARSDYFMNE